MNFLRKKIKFGTDGWRGIIGEDFTYENLGRLAIRIVDYLSDKSKSVCIGYDNRFMSPEYARFFAAVLEKNSITVDLSDKAVSTPCVSHRTNRNNYDLGIMISASHNPSNYNGVKIKENYGGSAREKIVKSIIHDLNSIDYSGSTWGLSYDGVENNWEKEYLQEFLKVIPEGKLKVICDYMHGSAYPYFDKVLNEKGYQIISIRNSRDPLFGGSNPEPKPATLQGLVDKVRAEGADIGFAFDGDGDRIAVVDEKGRLLSMQVVLSVLAYDLLEMGKKGIIVKTVAGSYLVDRLAKKYGVDYKVVPIGFKNICPEILKGNVIIAGEESGGIGFGDYLPERDAIYTASKILEMISRRGKLLGEIWDEVKEVYGNSVYIREDFRMKSGYDLEGILKRIKKNVKSVKMSYKVENISEIDGIRINMEEGRWLLLRPSGTEPVIRIYAETESDDRSKELIKKGKEIIS